MLRFVLSLFALFMIVLPSKLVSQSLPFYDGTYQQVQQLASDKQQPFLIYVFNKNAKEHRKMLRKTWSNKQVRKYLAHHYQAGSVDVFSGREDAKLVQKHQVFKLPSTLIFTPDGNLIGKIHGFAAPSSLKSILAKHESFVKDKMYPRQVDIPSLIAAAPAKRKPVQEVSREPEKAYLSASRQVQPTISNQTENIAANSRGSSYETSTALAQTNKLEPLSRGMSRGQSQLHLDVPGMHEYSLVNKNPADLQEKSLGLLIGSYTSYKQLRQMVSKFQRVWKGNMWVFAEEVNQIPVYKLVLGDYTSREEAEIFVDVIYKIDKSNPVILDLSQIVN